VKYEVVVESPGDKKGLAELVMVLFVLQFGEEEELLSVQPKNGILRKRLTKK